MAEGPGFEPGLTGPEPVVLPLDDPSVVYNRFIYSVFVNASSEFMVLIVRIVEMVQSGLVDWLIRRIVDWVVSWGL